MSALVQFIDVGKSFGSERALSHVTLVVARSEITVLIGPSGCGKSTMLRLIAGLETADEGEVKFDGAPITADTITNVRQHLGYVIQDGGLFPHLTARANVALQARLLRRARDEIEKRIIELCELTRFPASALDRYPLELSGGQRQRVGLMRALMLSPQLLLLDEPFAALDPLVRASLQRDLKEICARLQQTVLLVTHDLAEAARLGSHLALMREGEIVQQGTIKNLHDKPATPFVSEFFSAQSGAAFA
ncbi:MAG: ATP-binding cassette domain-containing protein [Verrucomicrobiota bacterium]|nr:ATP-binding cassette domain-containing protein [Verrucomicrobiota bacterium]